MSKFTFTERKRGGTTVVIAAANVTQAWEKLAKEYVEDRTPEAAKDYWLLQAFGPSAATERWSDLLEADVPSPPGVEAFLDDLIVVCRRHNLALGHEDTHGAFKIYRPIDEAVETIEAWLRDASLDKSIDPGEMEPLPPDEFTGQARMFVAGWMGANKSAFVDGPPHPAYEHLAEGVARMLRTAAGMEVMRLRRWLAHIEHRFPVTVHAVASARDGEEPGADVPAELAARAEAQDAETKAVKICPKRPGDPGPHCVHDMRDHPDVVELDEPTCCWCGMTGGLEFLDAVGVTSDVHGPECGPDIETDAEPG